MAGSIEDILFSPVFGSACATISSCALSESLDVGLKDPLDNTLSNESTAWSIVVNDTRYVGHLRSEKSSVSKLEDTDGAVCFCSPHPETTKERNRRLLIQDRLVQAELEKTVKSKHSSKCSRCVGMLLVIDEEYATDEADRSTSGRDGCKSKYVAVVVGSTSYERLRE